MRKPVTDRMSREDVAKIVRNALAWAQLRLGSDAWRLRCLAFVEDAVERSNGIEVFGGDSARTSAVLYRDALRTGDAPAGAFLFFDCAGPVDGIRKNWGHVGLSRGDGTMIHAWDRVRIDAVASVSELVPAPGWSVPEYLGWVPIERVLRGSVPAVCPEDG